MRKLTLALTEIRLLEEAIESYCIDFVEGKIKYMSFGDVKNIVKFYEKLERTDIPSEIEFDYLQMECVIYCLECNIIEECTYLCEDNMDDVKNKILLWEKLRKL